MSLEKEKKKKKSKNYRGKCNQDAETVYFFCFEQPGDGRKERGKVFFAEGKRVFGAREEGGTQKIKQSERGGKRRERKTFYSWFPLLPLH